MWRHWIAGIAAFVVLTLAFAKCGDFDSDGPSNTLLVVVQSSLAEPLRASLERYAEDANDEGFDIIVEEFASSSVVELQALLYRYIDHRRIDGALLIGDLPYASFEQEGLAGDGMGFPTDIFLQDRHAIWVDTDGNDLYDVHMPLELEIEIYTSRLIGTADELQRYFERAHRYRREGSLVNPSAFIFIDDPWHETDTSNDLYLDRLYREVDVIQDRTESTLDNYVDKLTGDGAEFVFQKVHAGPRIMNFKDEPSDHQLYPRDVSRLNLKVSFLNLTNCSAAKFSEYERSLGEAYTVGTDYGLAIIGSTKVGHLARPDDFHKNLGDGMYWGEAYKAWYNSEGSDSDKWHLGVVLMGDPLLRVVGDVLPAAEQ